MHGGDVAKSYLMDALPRGLRADELLLQGPVGNNERTKKIFSGQ
jgi:hypothetical protein